MPIMLARHDEKSQVVPTPAGVAEFHVLVTDSVSTLHLSVKNVLVRYWSQRKLGLMLHKKMYLLRVIWVFIKKNEAQKKKKNISRFCY